MSVPYFGVAGAAGVVVAGAGVVAAAGPDTRIVFVAVGNLSAFAQSRLTCHIWSVESESWNPGIPLMRMPPFTFQYVSPGESSVTPLPSISFGGSGYIPFAIGVGGLNGTPGQPAQCSQYPCPPAERFVSS